MKINICIITPSRPHFGNTLTQLPFIMALKKAYGDCTVTLWSKFEASQVLVQPNAADKMINYSQLSSRQLLRDINSNHYDIIYNLRSGSGRIHLLLKLFSNAPTLYGLSRSNVYKYCYDKFVKITKGNVYIAHTHLQLLEHVTNLRCDTEIIGDLLDNKPKISTTLTLLPGGGAGDYKKWPLSSYISCAEKLSCQSDQINRIVIVLGPDERDYRSLIPKEIDNVPVEIEESPSLLRLIELAHATRLAIANDCGPAHIFQMMKTPMITLWGWKDKHSSPYATMQEWYLNHEHSWAIVPNDDSRKIQSITVEKVTSLAHTLLSRQNNPHV
jgi:ADP-heptose:LPS heptosyltransferase